jgi:hypothetical protein
MESGDENTKLFQSYAKGRNLSNTIWSSIDNAGQIIYSFDGLAQLGKGHFQNIFKEDNSDHYCRYC